VGDGCRCGLKVEYSFDGVTPLGTGGAVKKALPLLGERFFVMYGDSYLPIDYREVERAFISSGKPALMTVYKNEGSWDTSNVIFNAPSDNTPGAVTLYDKKNRTEAMNCIDYGLNCCLAEEIAGIEEESFDIADVFSSLSRDGKLAGVEVFTRFYEIGSFSGIEDFRRYISLLGG
jgi:NDP-sugar pyrophosphorylase family protein